jgi:hypothetical protein
MSYTYTQILPSDTIGNSLSSINNNYLTLEKETLNLKLTADNVWSFMQQYYIEYGPIIKDAINTVGVIAPNLSQATTLVETNSAGWLKPITIFYPTIFPSSYDNQTIVDTVSAWIQQYFPVIPEPTYVTNPITGGIDIIIASKPTYVENQKMIVYTHTWNINSNISATTVLTDATTCSSKSQLICATCKICYFGGTYCNFNTWVDCGGNCTDCSKCEELKCYYTAPAFTPLYSVGTSTDFISYAKGQISAAINIQYQDVGELQTINSFVFSVKDCNWILEKSLIG